MCSALSHDATLSRVLYDDFLRRRAPFKVFMKKATIKSIKYQLKHHCNPSVSVMEQLKIAQQEVSNSLSGTCDINFIFDLVVNYLFMTGNCRMRSSGINAMPPQAGCVQHFKDVFSSRMNLNNMFAPNMNFMDLFRLG